MSERLDPPSRSVPHAVFSAFCLVAWAGSAGAAEGGRPGALGEFSSTIRPILQARCVECHGPEEQEGGVDFAALKDEDVSRRRKLWKRAAMRVAAGEMPPEDARPLARDERDRLLRWMRAAAEFVDCGDPDLRDPGPTPLRRLTRTEYNHTIRDLLGLPFDAGQAVGMPEDGGEGFENLAARLGLAATWMDKVFAAADQVVERIFAADGTGERARRDLFVARPGKDLPAREAARRVITRLARRAYRRPPRGLDIERLLGFFDRASASGAAFEAAVRATIKPVLVSPQFLFRIEEDRPAPSGKAVGVEVDDHELAVRLSYFLWSTMPDDELSRLADEGRLSHPDVLEGQVRRLLKDPKARALTEDFAARWLQLKKLATARPSTEFFPTFNGTLRQAMRDEITTFFNALREEDRSLLDLLDADFTYANEVLATHYGLPGVKGPEMRRVALGPGDHRGGLLGMAGVLSLTSHTFRTSPTQRGKYVLEVVFGTPPPPPPPNAGKLKDDNPAARTQARTLREQLAQHAKEVACAACHRKIDPLGFALENYNAIGSWREATAEVPLDVSGVLPTGESIHGAADLKAVLLKRKDDFARNLVEKMLVYALGRELDDLDECTVRDAHETLRRGDYRLSSLVSGVIQSVPFRRRRAETAAIESRAR